MVKYYKKDKLDSCYLNMNPFIVLLKFLFQKTQQELEHFCNSELNARFKYRAVNETALT